MKKRVILFVFLFLMGISLGSCGNVKGGTGGNTAHTESDKGNEKSEDTTAESFTKSVEGDKTKVTFTDNDEVLMNPLMGWQITASMDEIIKHGVPDGYGSVLLRQSWDELEPEEGQFKWDKLDASIAVCQKANVSIQLGMYLQASDVYNFPGIPEWIWTKYNIPHQMVNTSSLVDLGRENDYPTKHPQYENKLYQEKAGNFLRAFAARYPDGTADILDVRFYGLYGEWDTGWNPYTWPSREVKSKALGDWLNMYIDIFKDYKKTKLCIDSIPDAASRDRYTEYRTEARHDIAIANRFAFRTCAIGVNNIAGGITDYLVAESFPHSPVNAETYYGWDPKNFNLEQTLNTFYQVHTNIVHFGQGVAVADSIRFQNLEAFDKAAKTMGYRLLPEEITYNHNVKPGDTLTISSKWSNLGVGVCWRQYPIKYRLKDEKGNTVYEGYDKRFDQTLWVKGETYDFSSEIKLPEALFGKKAQYEIYISLIDDTGKNAIALPIGYKNNLTREYNIGSVTLV